MAAKIFPSSHTHRLTLRRDGPAVICPQLAQRHVAGRAWWTHPHTVGVVGSEERAGWTVFEQRRQNQHRMPPAVRHLGHSLWERNVISCHFLIPSRTHTTHITSRSYNAHHQLTKSSGWEHWSGPSLCRQRHKIITTKQFKMSLVNGSFPISCSPWCCWTSFHSGTLLLGKLWVGSLWSAAATSCIPV